MFDYKFETINETLIITIKGTFDTIGAQKIQDEFKILPSQISQRLFLI